jgi:3-deoxy-D-manno-octulosonic-acid transferase
MFILYDLAFVIFAIIYLPYFLLRKKLHQGFFQRLGFLPFNLGLEQPIWIHAVSVGEARVAQALVKQLRGIYPEKRFVFSNVTTTGNRIVHSFKEGDDFVFYLPLDLSFIVRRVVRKLRPCICIIVETEIWPNLITQLKKNAVPVVLVNARISDRSFLGYRIIRPLIKPILNKIDLFCVQSSRDAQRLSVLGAKSDKLKITGNMKYDFKDYTDYKRDYTDYKLKLGLGSKERLFVAGSTHPGEEKIVLNTYKRLLNEFPDLRLLIAPRHPERAKEIERLAAKLEFQSHFISTVQRTTQSAKRKAIFILDTIGQLRSFYAIADIVFVGGSLIKRGGQNILEPAYFSKAILFGPYMFNFRDISELFLERAAARRVQAQEGLLREVKFLLNNPSELETMGEKARQLVLGNQGATKRNIELIKGMFP